MGRKLRIQLGENKEDKYGNRWKAKTICVHKSTQREEQPEREREREKKERKARAQVGGGRVRAQVGENKGDKHGDRRSQSHQNEEHRAMEREVRAWETRRFL